MDYFAQKSPQDSTPGPILSAFIEQVKRGNAAPKVVEMALCEAGRVILRPDTLYRFTVHAGCQACADANAPYL